jgi:hypothetical protein
VRRHYCTPRRDGDAIKIFTCDLPERRRRSSFRRRLIAPGQFVCRGELLRTSERHRREGPAPTSEVSKCKSLAALPAVRRLFQSGRNRLVASGELLTERNTLIQCREWNLVLVDATRVQISSQRSLSQVGETRHDKGGLGHEGVSLVCRLG